MKKQYLILIIGISIYGCRKNDPRIVYDDKINTMQADSLNDSENNEYKKLIADLPFTFDSLAYLYFPIGETNESFNMNIRTFSSSYSTSTKPYSIGYSQGRNVNGNFNNILIRSKKSSDFTLLTKSELKIKSMTYLFRIDTLYGIDRFIYRIIDSDSNNDTFISDGDLVSLYCSKTSGEGFKKISPKNQHLIDWETYDLQGLLYFRSMEDIDLNGKFDDKDRINLYEYDLIKGDEARLIFNNGIYKELK